MALDTIIQTIAQTIHVDADGITAETELSSLGIDSLKAINILFELEEVFKVEIPNEVIAELKTVSDIENTLNQLLGDQ